MKRRLRILISLGPTRESLDPVRFISNYSTGTLGTALARACMKGGHRVTVAYGVMSYACNELKTRKIPFDSVLDLKKVLTKEIPKHDVLFMVAAVSDFKPLSASATKIKKGNRFLQLSLVENPDVLKSLSRFKPGKVFVGFCLESQDLYQKALSKLKAKNLDLIVAQKATDKTVPFGAIPIDALVIYKNGRKKAFRRIDKQSLSRFLVRETELIASTVCCTKNK